jgi:hypothetical protein
MRRLSLMIDAQPIQFLAVLAPRYQLPNSPLFPHRRLTEHVTITHPPSAPAPAPEFFPVPSAPAPSIPNSAPHIPLSALQPPVPVIAPPPLAPSPGPPQSIRELLAQAEYEQLDLLGPQLEAQVTKDTFMEFIEIWKEIALAPTLVQQNRSAVSPFSSNSAYVASRGPPSYSLVVHRPILFPCTPLSMQVPFAMLFAHTSPSFQDSVKQALIPHLLRHLNQLRGPDAPRGEFYLHAEVFAAMVSIGVVPLKVKRELGANGLKNPIMR